jgi:putative DNA primase/helicase
MTEVNSSTPDEDRRAFAAWDFAQKGWRVLPVHWVSDDGRCSCREVPWMPPCEAAGKHPIHTDWTTAATTDAERIAQWWGAEHPEANIGVATGSGSGVWVLDVDEGRRRDGTFKEGLDSLMRLIADHGDLPPTFATRTGGGGNQFFFEVPVGYEIVSKPKALGEDFPDIDTRGEGGQVVVPPSVSGKGPYEIESDVPVAETPPWLLGLLVDAGSAHIAVSGGAQPAPNVQTAAPAVPTPQTLAALVTAPSPQPPWFTASVAAKLQSVRDAPDGAGNDTINRMAYMIGQYIPNGWLTEEEAHAWLMDAVASWSHPHPAADYTIRRALSQGQSHPYQDLAAVANSGDLSDAVMADRVCAELLSGRYCWAPGMEWLKWTGQVWEPSDEVEVTEEVRQYVLAEVRATLPTVAGNAAARRAVTDLMTRGKINNMMQLARGPLRVDARRFDSHADLLNTPSGVVDLRTGTVRSHDPGLWFTKITSAEYVPDATHPDWEKSLEAVPPGCREWLQIRIGQAITGYTNPDDTLVLLQGGGENGKTTVLAAIMEAVGAQSFAVDVPKQVLVGKSDDPHALMPFRGARLAMIEELPEGRRLSATRIKETVGTPHMTGRFMYKNLVTWRATHSLFLTTNYIPSVAETDHGTWRRLLMLRFPYRFRKAGEPMELPNDRPGDEGLRDRMLGGGERSTAVLAWAVRGAIEWYRHERRMPPVPAEVRVATQEWRTESDLILAFWRDRLERDSQSKIMAEDLFAAFRMWLAAKGHPNQWASSLISNRFGSHDETMSAHLIKDQMVADEHVSRPGGQPLDEHAGKMRMCWAGVRFKTL